MAWRTSTKMANATRKKSSEFLTNSSQGLMKFSGCTKKGKRSDVFRAVLQTRSPHEYAHLRLEDPANNSFRVSLSGKAIINEF